MLIPGLRILDKMIRKSAVKRVIDILMTLSLLFLMGFQFWGQVAHEVAGAFMGILFVAHNVLNFSWYRSIFRGRCTPMRIFQLAVNLLTLLSMLALMYSGIMLSGYVFAPLGIEGSLSLARRLHILGSHWGFILMSLHLGLHWNMVIRHMNAIRIRKLLPYIGTIIAIYGVYVFISRNFISYMLLQSEFVFLDYEEPVILFYIDYLALMGLCIYIAHYASHFMRRLKKEPKEKIK